MPRSVVAAAAPKADPSTPPAAEAASPRVLRLPEHTVEIVSDSGEGAQKCAQIFAAVSAKMGNGVWTVELIPAEIQPPPRVPEGASGNRVRLGEKPVTNWGDRTNLVIAFNEQVLLARHRVDALADDAVLLIEDKWARSEDPEIVAAWNTAMDELSTRSYRIVPVAMEDQCLSIVADARKGKNMFALGMLARIYDRDMTKIKDQIAYAFRKKSEEVYAQNVSLLELGYHWAEDNIDFRVEIKTAESDKPLLVMNGNEALALGAVASGMELCAMYPITPATSVSHLLSEIFERFGGIVHQAEDEIAAAGVAIGASYSGKVAFTVTSGPGLALKTEFLGLAVMTETPLVLVDVQRGGPSTGLPTKVEQSDLLAALFASTGDAPHVVLAPATIEECFHVMVTARRLAETFRTVVMVLSDANLATGVTPFAQPTLDESWQAAPLDLSPVREGQKPYGWDPETGLSDRIIPGRPGGMFTLTGLSHDDRSKVAYSSGIHQHSSAMRSRKLAVLQSLLTPPPVNGDPEGDLLVVGWGSTKGAIEEAVERARALGMKVSSTHLRFLSPLEPGLKQIFSRFKRVMTVEINYSDEVSDPYVTDENRRRGQLAFLLRAATLVDVDCWTRVPGEPLRRSDFRSYSRPHAEERWRVSYSCGLLPVLNEGENEHQYEMSEYEGAKARWCPGCGDHSVLTSVQRLLSAEQLIPDQTMFVSGIGCSSRFPHYLRTYGFHGLHGRALPVATGIKLHRPELNVFVVMGDGDCTSIGAGHWLHALRYNMDLTVLMLDNGIYGLTKNQTSPTTPQGFKSNTQPQGSFLPPMNPIEIALGVTNASFVAQTAEWAPAHMYATLQAAYKHKGFSFVRILQRCPVFTPLIFQKAVKDPARIQLLVHDEGVVAPELDKIYARKVQHDPLDLAAARSMAEQTEFINLGLFFKDPSRPRYEDTRRVPPKTAKERVQLLEKEFARYAV